MEKYREIVEAQQFHYKNLDWPKDCKATITIYDGIGSYDHQLLDGDWIVAHSNDDKEIVSAEEFPKRFEKIEK